MGTIKKIDRRDVADILALTPMQEGMLFHYKYNSDKEAYFEQLSLNLTGVIKYEIVGKAWNIVAENNELLRTVFRWDKLEKPIQIILKKKEVPIRQYDLSGYNSNSQEEMLEEIRQKDKDEGINLELEPFRVTLCKLHEDEYEMMVSNHHILYDGWSNGILLKEFLAVYTDLLEDQEPKENLKTSFKEFVNWVNRQDLNQQKQYWGNYLRGFEQTTTLSKQIIQEDAPQRTRRHTWTLSEELGNRIEEFTKEKNIRLAVLLYCAWGILLQRYNDVEDVVFGTTVSGRNPKIKGIEDMVGLFINTLPLRIEGGADDSVNHLIKTVDRMLNEREEYESTPLAEIQKTIQSSGNSGIFDTLIIIENYPLDQMLKNKEGKIQINSYTTQEATNYDLTVGIKVFDDIQIDFCYLENKFEEKEISTLASYYENILKELLESPNKRLSEIELLSKEEKNKLLYDFNPTNVEMGGSHSIMELFQQQAEKTPSQIAVKLGDQEYTYRQLNNKANQLARRLREEGEMREGIVGIMLDPSLEMCVAILGVLKAGAGYLPIDPSYPKDRIQYMFEDGTIEILVSQQTHQGKMKEISFNGTWIDVEENTLREKEDSNLEYKINPEDLAYIIYTSGSTGRPKGVMVEHRSICNAIAWRKREYKLTKKDRILQLFSFSFDGFLTSFFTPLVSGATVILMKEEERKNPLKIKECIVTEKISHFIAVPSLYSYILDELSQEEAKSLKIVTLAGEKITKEIIKKSQEINEAIEITNEYGPTENSVVSTIQRKVSLENYQSIGRPIANTAVYILGKKDELRPVGLSGEICLAGKGLARGYLNKPEITEERFISNPFVEGERLYKTGDLGRWLENGTLEYLGRVDHQVKIRGFRIELGEIESQLIELPMIKEAVVLAQEEEEGNPYLWGYITVEEEIKISEVRRHLAKSLPEYMIPSYFMILDKIPLTPNGKVDRRALPIPGVMINSGTIYEAPINETERKMVGLWEKVLVAKEIGRNDNFFDRGGHSLKAASLAAQIHKEFNIEIPLKVLFDSPTLQEMAEYIDHHSRENLFVSLEPLEEKEFYPVASAQNRVFMLQNFESQNIGYNISGALQMEGDLDKEKLQGVFQQLVNRHEAFRTSFEIQGEEVVQKIHGTVKFEIKQFEINKFAIKESGGEKGQVDSIIKDFIAPFDLSKAPLLRVGLIKIAENKHVLMMDMHHIIADGTSMGIIVREFIELYEDKGEVLPELKIQYKEYATWQLGQMNSKEMESHKKYWLDRFKDEIPPLNIHTDRPRNSLQNLDGDTLDFSIDKELTAKLKSLAKNTETTMYMILLAAFTVLLSKYSNQEDIVVGSPIAGRNHEDFKGLIGMFVNTLPMRNFPNAKKTFKEFLQEVKENALQAYQHQHYPFDDLVDQLKIQRDPNRNPLFDVLFAMQNMEMPEIQLRDLTIESYPYRNNIAKFDLSLFASEVGEGLALQMEYSRIYYKETVERLIKGFVRLLHQIADTHQILLADIDLLSQEEKDFLVWEKDSQYKMDLEATTIFPQEKITVTKTIHQRFEDQVERTPHKIALFSENKTMTYKELNEKANQLARVLRGKGVKPASIVGLMVERSFEMIIALLAVMKAGGAYLPIDMEYPEDRIAYMLEDSKVDILLTQKEVVKNIPHSFQGECIDLMEQTLYKGCKENLDTITRVDDLIYIVYTSGSTGNPKGIMMEHKNLNNLINHELREDGIDFNTRVLQFALISFDVSFQEMFLTFFSGGELYLITKEMRNDLDKLFDFIKEEEIEVLFFPTAFLKFVMSEDEYIEKFPRNCKHIITAGEQLIISEGFKKYLKANNVFLHNHYGPSEAHVITTLIIDPQGDIPAVPSIGKPIVNNSIYIMDPFQRLQPLGVAGELYVAGESVGRGYLDKPELTTEKFLLDPFKQGRRMYRTGDLARWRSDGNIEFLGRIDDQVKVRGHRIEISEIELQLSKHEEIKEAVVVARKDEKGANELFAYIVGKEGLSATEIRGYLGQRLPEYMIPSYFFSLEKMPLTANGKVDKKALAKLGGMMEVCNQQVKPTTELEKKLAKIWSEVLKVQEIGITENFFDLGGHSLRATILLSKIHKELEVEIPLKEIFRTPTIEGLAAYIEKIDGNKYSSIPIAEEKDYYPLSFPQKRMYTLYQFQKDSTSYNMPGAMKIIGKISLIKVEEAFKELIKRHEALRTSFETSGDEVIQRVHKNEDVAFDVLYKEGKEEDTDRLIGDFIKAFDLSKAPLLRVEIVSFTEDSHLLLFDVHHIISDGASMAILIQEFLQLYQEKDLPEQRIQYKDYTAWQQQEYEKGVLNQQEEYWLERFVDEIPVLNLPEDYRRPAVQSFEGDRIRFELNEKTTEAIKAYAKEQGATLYMVLLAAYTMLLGKYSSQEDVVVGSPIAGRRHAQLDHCMGIFVNTLAMRNYPAGEKTFKEFLQEVKGNALMAYENQEYQFEELIDQLNLERDLSRNPLFDVMFVMQNVDIPEIEIEGAKFIPYEFENKISKFTMTLMAREIGDGISFDLEYATKIFKKTTMEGFRNHFIKALQYIIGNPGCRLGDIEIITEEEKYKILQIYNDTQTQYPREKTVIQLFEEQVLKTPENIAVVYEDMKFTYREVKEKANALAKRLRDKGVRPGEIVGLYASRSIEMIYGIVAILKAGGVYLPIDPEYPKERIEYMLEDCNVNMLLVGQPLKEEVDFGGIILDLKDEAIFSGSYSHVECQTTVTTATDLVCIMYTSGSTGVPKGVMLEHRNIVRLVKNTNYISIEERDGILQAGAVVFDVSIFEIWGSFLNGATLYLINKEILINAKKLRHYLENNQTTIAFITTALFNQLVEEDPQMFHSFRSLIVGGDAVSPKHMMAVKKYCKDVTLIDGYGPTENTTFSTTFTIPEDFEGSIPIGKPVSNSTAYILDQNRKLQPIGVPGELWVGGDGVARGYLNKPHLTEEKFIQSPFVAGERIYQTGDLARWLPDGNIEFLGRMDNQVKIRGFRIEIDEIEKQISNSKLVGETVVTVNVDNGGNKYLCAYFTAKEQLDASSIRKYLLQKLPSYMVPSYFLQLDKIPLTTNGKVNKRALPTPEEVLETNSNYIAPRNDIENKLAEIFSDVLDVNPVGIKDHFFEMGGHSLKAVKAMNMIHREFFIKLSLQDLFNLPTIELLGEKIQEEEIVSYHEIKSIEKREYYELSNAQQRLWIVNQLEKDSISYNLPGRVTLNEKVDSEIISKVFTDLISRHESFRTRFITVDGKPVQVIEDTVDFSVETMDLLAKSNEISAKEQDIFMTEEELSIKRDELFHDVSTKVFDLEKAPLLRVTLVKVKEEEYDLIFSMHHIISDGWSMEVLRKEFYGLYEGYKAGKKEELPPLKIQYKDFAAWQNQMISHNETMERAKEFWLEQLSGDLSPLSLPINPSGRNAKERNSSAYQFFLSEELKDKIKSLAKEHQTSIFVILLAAYSLYLSELTGQEDILIGTAGSGRDHESLKNVIGYFINTTILRNKIDTELSFNDLIDQVKENTLKALEYQNYPLEFILDELKIKYPEISVFFNMLNMGESEREELESFEAYHVEKVQDVKFDLVCYIIEYKNGIKINCNYLSSLFKPTRIEYMMTEYVDLLENLVESPDAVAEECI